MKHSGQTFNFLKGPQWGQNSSYSPDGKVKRKINKDRTKSKTKVCGLGLVM